MDYNWYKKVNKSMDKLFNKYINSKNHNKELIHNEYKRYRNLIVNLTRLSEKNIINHKYQKNMGRD